MSDDDRFGVPNHRELAQQVRELERVRANSAEFFADRATPFVSDVAEQLARAAERRKERALLGAWRAGFDYVYEVFPEGRPLDVAYVPTDSGYTPARGYVAIEHDIAGTDDEEILRRIRENDSLP